VYSVTIERDARKTLARVPAADSRRLLTAIAALSANPRPPGCKKLVDRDGWRIRVGNYRVIYDINDDGLTVLVVTVATRGDVYR
jgi:mRNA interferase RelE/StbE